jgi:hypothetical protein
MKEESTSTSTATAKSKAKAKAKAKSDAAKARRRTKMPEEEQKRRNCESAKRSRLKRMAQLEGAKKRVAELEQENQAWRQKFAQIREWGYNMAVHLATSHHNCSCSAHQNRAQLEQMLTSPMCLPR